MGQNLAQDPRMSSQSWAVGRYPPDSSIPAFISHPCFPSLALSLLDTDRGPLPGGGGVPDHHRVLAALHSHVGTSFWSYLLLLLFFCSPAHFQKVILTEARDQRI